MRGRFKHIPRRPLPRFSSCGYCLYCHPDRDSLVGNFVSIDHRTDIDPPRLHLDNIFRQNAQIRNVGQILALLQLRVAKLRAFQPSSNALLLQRSAPLSAPWRAIAIPTSHIAIPTSHIPVKLSRSFTGAWCHSHTTVDRERTHRSGGLAKAQDRGLGIQMDSLGFRFFVFFLLTFVHHSLSFTSLCPMSTCLRQCR